VDTLHAPGRAGQALIRKVCLHWENSVANAFRCRIITPSESVFDDEVSYVSFPAWDGQQGVMDGQSPLLTRLGIGPARLTLASGEIRWFMLDGGFAQINDGVLTLLSEHAIEPENISLDKAKAELTEANTAAVAGGKDRDEVEAAQQRARAKIALAQAQG